MWQAQLDRVRAELLKTDDYKEQAQQLAAAADEARAKLKEVQKQLDVSKKYKMGAEKKIRDLHAKANKLPTLELEFKNLKDKLYRAEKSRDIIVEKLKKKEKNELRERNATETSLRSRNESFANARDPALSTDKALGYGKPALKPMVENVENMEYDFKKKTEMKSLRGLVRHLNKQLVAQKSLSLDARLFNFRLRAPNFERLSRMYNAGVQLSRGPIDALAQPRASQNPLNNLLDSGLGGAGLKTLAEASEEGSVNEANKDRLVSFTYQKPAALSSIESSIFEAKRAICRLEVLDLRQAREFEDRRGGQQVTKNNYDSLAGQSPLTRVGLQQKQIADKTRLIRKQLFKLRKSNRGRKPPVNEFFELRKRLEKMDPKVVARIAFKKDRGKGDGKAILRNDTVLKNHAVMIV